MEDDAGTQQSFDQANSEGLLVAHEQPFKVEFVFFLEAHAVQTVSGSGKLRMVQCRKANILMAVSSLVCSFYPVIT